MYDICRYYSELEVIKQFFLFFSKFWRTASRPFVPLSKIKLVEQTHQKKAYCVPTGTKYQGKASKFPQIPDRQRSNANSYIFSWSAPERRSECQIHFSRRFASLYLIKFTARGTRLLKERLQWRSSRADKEIVILFDRRFYWVIWVSVSAIENQLRPCSADDESPEYAKHLLWWWSANKWLRRPKGQTMIEWMRTVKRRSSRCNLSEENANFVAIFEIAESELIAKTDR